MCGLFGFVESATGPAVDVERARAARDALVHRGPDQVGEWSDGSRIYLGHRRLSILDTSPTGQQPMSLEGVHITVNGEIYNFRELRRELEARGHRFLSSSDSEVVLHGYRAWGIGELVERLRGMYGAVIFDSNTNRIFAFRDRVGIKPLYYFFGSGRFGWASELKALTHYLDADALSTDEQALLDFLVYRYLPAPKSLYREIHKLEAASILEYPLDGGSPTVRRYWSLPCNRPADPAPDFTESLREAIVKAVGSQLVSDVPLGVLLSGGLDSCAVATAASRSLPQLTGYTVGFRGSARDEVPAASELAEHLGIAHAAHYLDAEVPEDLYARMQTWFDEPFGDTSAIPTHAVCRFARSEVTVALSGDGGDELFGGYRWYGHFHDVRRAQRRWRRLPERGLPWPGRRSRHRQLRWLSIGDPLWLYAAIRGALAPGELETWRQRLGVPADYDMLWAYRRWYDAALPPRRAAQRMDFHSYLPDDILTKVDRVSMACSLECRPVLLDQDLIEHAFSLPESFVYADASLKGGLRRALAPWVPESVRQREKQGFSIPGPDWRAPLIERHGSLQEALLDPFLRQAGVT